MSPAAPGVPSDSDRRRLALGLLLAAIIAGALLRFPALGTREMSADEGATWAAAAAATVTDVVRLHAVYNPGKLAFHEVILHYWIVLFGDRLRSMRAMSAALGTLAIFLAFTMVRELFAESEAERERPGFDPAVLAAMSAFVLAVNLVTIKYSREIRMYPLLLCAAIAQVWTLIRLHRSVSATRFFALAVLTLFLLAANFSAAFLLAAEGMWLIYALWAAFGGPDRAIRRRHIRSALASGAAIVFGLAIAMPFMTAAIRESAAAVNAGAIAWIRRPPLWEPIGLFNKATGSFAFPVVALLAAWGAIRGWRRFAEAIRFLLCWMFGPILLMLIVSYTLRPILVERYALSCFVPFFVFAALGILEVQALGAYLTPAAKWNPIRPAVAFALVLVLSLGHCAGYYSRAHGYQWREAVCDAQALAGRDGMIEVAPAYAFNVVRYYLAPNRRTRAQGIAGADALSAGASIPGRVLILADQGVAATEAAALKARYPRVAARTRGIEVRSRDWSDPVPMPAR